MLFKTTLIILLTLPFVSARAEQVLLKKAAEFIRDEAISLSGTKDVTTEIFRYSASLSAMAFVQSRLSALRYAAQMTKEGFQPPATPEESLRRGIGLCGHHTDTFEAILSELGIPTRRVQVFFRSSTGEHYNHVFPEVFWGGAWHMFDVTNGFIPVDASSSAVLSFEDVRSGIRFKSLLNQTSAWYRGQVQNSQAPDPLEYLTANEADIITNGEGVTRPYIGSATASEINYSFSALINYVGTAAVRKGVYGNHSIEIDVPTGFRYLKLTPGGSECTAGSLVLNDAAVPMPSGPVSIEVPPGPLRVSVRTNERPCYVVIDRLTLQSRRSD